MEGQISCHYSTLSPLCLLFLHGERGGEESGCRVTGGSAGCRAVAGPIRLHRRQQSRSKAALFPLSKAGKPLKTPPPHLHKRMTRLCHATVLLKIAPECQILIFNDIHIVITIPFPF